MDSTQDKYRIDMVNGPLIKNLFIFSIPLMFANFLQILFNVADTVVVGRFAGDTALAAVGATGSIVFLLTALFNGLGVGGNVTIAKFLGSQEDDKISQAVHTSICIAIIGGILLAIVGIGFSTTILKLMSTPDNILELSSLYMKIYFGGAVFMLVYNFGSAILRSKGDTKRPLYFLAASGILNVLLNLLFVIVFNMSVAGVAIATVISQGCAAGLVIAVLAREKDSTRLEMHKLRLHGPMVSEIMRVGIPAGIQGMVFSISNVVIQSSINSFDSSIIVAGNSAAANLEGFVYIGMSAFSQATMTFTSQNVGAKKYEAILRIFFVTLLLAALSGFIVSFVVYIFGNTFLGFYTNKAAVIEAGMIRLKYVALWLWLNGVLDVFVNSMRGMGYSTLPTAIMLIGICGFRLVWIWTVFARYNTLETIYLCFPLSWLITSILQAFLLVHVYRKLMKNA